MSEGNEASYIFEEMEDAYNEAANVEKGVYDPGPYSSVISSHIWHGIYLTFTAGKGRGGKQKTIVCDYVNDLNPLANVFKVMTEAVTEQISASVKELDKKTQSIMKSLLRELDTALDEKKGRFADEEALVKQLDELLKVELGRHDNIVDDEEIVGWWKALDLEQQEKKRRWRKSSRKLEA
jgi:hypothetical protein